MVSRRRGITLIELLVVIFIILLITSITIPAIQPALENRRTREAARLVNVFFNAARNRALEQGRPAGVWIERQTGLSEASVTLHFAEIPKPYSGDFLDSAVSLFYEPFGAPFRSPTIREYWLIVTPRTLTGGVPDRWWNAEPNAQHLIRPGDYIRFSGVERALKLNVGKRSDMRLAGGDTWVWYLAYGANKNSYNGGFTGARDNDGNLVINWWDNDFRGLHTPLRTHLSPTQVRVPGVSYQIFRQPQKMSAGAVQLPQGTVIDLNFSGTSSWNFHPRDNFVTNNSTLAGNPYRGKPIFPNDETPIIILFSPDGVVDRVYSRMRNDDARIIDWNSWRPTSLLYFLIGDAEKIPAKSGWGPGGPGAGGFDQYQNNWLDLTNYWVTINPFTGLVNTAEVSDFDERADPANQISFDPANIHVTRRFANQPQAMGGR